MAVSTMIKAIKQVHCYDLVMVKIGSFYHAYGKDSYILSYLFGYKLKKFEKEYSTCGFPADSISKITSKLENKKINYVLLDRRNEYDKIAENSNGNLNKYQEYFEKANKYVNMKKRIDNIYKILIENIDAENAREKICEIEETIYEKGKI